MNIVYDTHLETDHLEVTIDDEFGYPKNLTNTHTHKLTTNLKFTYCRET